GGRPETQPAADARWIRPPGNEERWLPRAANLDLAVDPILPPPQDAVPAPGPADATARKAGETLDAMLRDAQRTTLAAIRVLDRAGIVVASTGEALGQSLAGQEEVSRALRGEPVSTLRERGSPAPPSALSAIDTGSQLRIFTALPV